jgi:hypothetical protein
MKSDKTQSREGHQQPHQLALGLVDAGLFSPLVQG